MEINGIENEKINKAKSCFFYMINKFNKPLARLIWIKIEDSNYQYHEWQISNIMNDIIRISRDTERIIRKYANKFDNLEE